MKDRLLDSNASYSVPTPVITYPNMLRKSATHQKKVDLAVRVLQTTTGVKVPGAIILAGFSKSDGLQAKSCNNKYDNV